MRHFGNIELGAATHTGRVRSANEDDFLVIVPQTPEQLAAAGSLFVIADGMGGAAGGAEASRTAVRALARVFLSGNGEQGEAGDPGDPGEAGEPGASHEGDALRRMSEGFRVAALRVYGLSRGSLSLRDMGTTLTAANVVGDRLILGHVGDSRCLLYRDGQVLQLSTDHAVREPQNYLTRCIGAGQRNVDVELLEHPLQEGDRIVLATDGLWAVVQEAEIARIISALPTQEAAEELVRLANRNGGPDNSTVLVVLLHSLGEDPGQLLEVDLPSEEVRQPALLRQPDRSLVAPRWPIFLWVLSAGLVLLGLLELLLGVGFTGNLLGWLR